MRILQIIDDKTEYHKEFEKIFNDMENYEITTYSISSIQNEYEILQLSIDVYDYINNSFDCIFIHAIPKKMNEYYLMITQYVTIKKYLFIDFTSLTNLFSNISESKIKKLIDVSEKTFIFNSNIYNRLSKNKDNCVKLNHFKVFDNTNNFIEYDNKNKSDILLSDDIKDDYEQLNYNFFKIKSSIILYNIIHNDPNVNYIKASDINKMFIYIYEDKILSKELFNIVYNGILIFINKKIANNLYINDKQKISDTRCCIIYDSLEDLQININKFENSKNTYESMRNNTFNTFKQISNIEIKKIISAL